LRDPPLAAERTNFQLDAEKFVEDWEDERLIPNSVRALGENVGSVGERL
jgi:hypothetical protein